MSNIRRWYIYLVSAVSLQTMTWAIIGLLRNLLISNLHAPTTLIAFQIAVILIGLPVFLAHWLWGQWLTGKAVEERGATLRRFYLYATMAAFLGPFARNSFDLVGTLLGVSPYRDIRHTLESGDAVVYRLVAMFVLGLLCFYHQRVVAGDSVAVPETGGAATVRRLYVLGFSTAGLTATTLAIINLSRWLMLQFGREVVTGGIPHRGLRIEITRLIIGLPLWLLFWRWAQQLFRGPSEEERESALRKLYLYGAIFIGTMGVVTNVTMILAGFFRRVLALRPQGDIRGPLSVIIGMGVLWVYHTFVIRDDAQRVREAPRQAGVRRLYLYLVAVIGLSALLVGLGGDASVVIRSLDRGLISGLREQLAWFTAAIIAGLPVWILPWRQAQSRTVESGPAGMDARRSIVRKIYVYFFLFVATMTVLSGAVFIAYKILGWFLGLEAPTLNELAHAIAFSAIAVGVWLYHAFVLFKDHRLSDQERIRQLQDLRIAVVDAGDGRFGQAVVEGLKREAPELDLALVVLVEPGAVGLDEEAEIATQLAQAGLIVGPWIITMPGGAGGVVSPKVAQAVTDSPARKLLTATRSEGWEWAGVDRWNAEALVRQTVQAVRQIAAGEEVRPARPMGAGTVIAIIIGVLFLLILLAIPLLLFATRMYW